MTNTDAQIKISSELAKKLFPLTLTIFALVTFVSPSLYGFFEYRALKEEANIYSQQLANEIKLLVSTSPDLWKYQSTKYSQIISSFIPHKKILSITLADEYLTPINQYSHTSSTDNKFKSLGVQSNPASILFNNHKIGEILITVSADTTLLHVFLVFIACLLIGTPLSLFIYRLPLSIVRKIELQLVDYQQVLEDKSKLEVQNRQLQKIESLNRMAGAIAHHFNNKLAAVIGNLELVLEELPQHEKGPFRGVTKAMQAAHQAAEVSGHMLTYLGHGPGTHEPLDLSEACRKSLPLLQAAAPGGHIFKSVDLPSPGPAIKANANQIQQVLTNLVTNAWEANEENQGTIDLTVKTVSSPDIPKTLLFPIGWQPQDLAYGCLEVTDTGCGIANEDIDKLFDPFFSTKFTGRGLGLPVVLGIAKAHGGAVTVESKTGKGSTFRVFFPMSAEVVPPQTEKAEQPLTRERGGTVLLVEDEEMIREMSAAMLMRFGFTVLAAKDGAEAVEVYRQRQNEICCVVCDLTMPRMDGYETFNALRQINPKVKVLLTSGYSKEQVKVRFAGLDLAGFIQKPFSQKELVTPVLKALEGEDQKPL